MPDVIASTTQIQINYTPKHCLLGLAEKLANTVVVKTLLSLLLLCQDYVLNYVLEKIFPSYCPVLDAAGQL